MRVLTFFFPRKYKQGDWNEGSSLVFIDVNVRCQHVCLFVSVSSDVPERINGLRN